MNILTENRDVLDEIAKVLIEKEKIDGKELLNVIKSINPDLISDKAFEAVSNIMVPKTDDDDTPELQPAVAAMEQIQL